MRPVNVWRASLDRPADELAALENLLSKEERGRASQFRKAIDRERYATGRATLRILIGDCISTPPELVALRVLPGGKPVLEETRHASHIHFNVSHCGGIALFAFSDHEVGIDVERIQRNSDTPRIAATFFSPDETAAFGKMHGTERDRFFFRTWVRKEAYLKATGRGLGIDPAHLYIGDSDGSEATIVDPKENTRIDHAFKIFDIADMGDHVAAIAVASPICPPAIRFREFTPLQTLLPG